MPDPKTAPEKFIAPGKASIIYLGGYDHLTQSTIVAIILKNLFDERASMRNKIPPLLTIIEEAHNFIPSRGEGQSETPSVEIIRKVIEGNLDYQVRFKESTEYFAIFEGIDDLELIEEVLKSIKPENYNKIPNEIKKKIINESNNKKLKTQLIKKTPVNEINQEFKIWGLKTLINSMSSELYWVLTNNRKSPQITFQKIIDNIKDDVLQKFEINKNVILKRIEEIPNFYGSDEIQKKIILIGEILKIIEEKNPIRVSFDEKFKAFLMRAKIYSDILVKKFNGSEVFNRRIELLLKNF